MKKSCYINEDQLLKKAIDILMEKLGPVETNRLVMLLNHTEKPLYVNLCSMLHSLSGVLDALQ